VIETVQRPSFHVVVPRKGKALASDETQDGRARENVLVAEEEKAMKRKPGRVAPAGSKGPCEVPRFGGIPGAQEG